MTEKAAMVGREAFKIWAPPGCKWSAWVRPVPFIFYNPDTLSQVMSYTLPDIFFTEELQSDTAIFVDLPDYEGVKVGLALAKLGWQPVPLYNGTDEKPGGKAITENHSIEYALIWGAGVLSGIDIKKDAPPAFLIDSNRMHRYRPDASVFDNSWDLYSQDIPSADYFLENEITKIVVFGEKIQKDLKRIFYKLQKKGIEFYFTKGYKEPERVAIRKQR